MTLSVVIPTITGREESFEKILAAYQTTLADVSHEIVVVKDEPNWPSACNAGYHQTTGEIVHFTADDLEPVPGWHQEAVQLLEVEDVLPAGYVWNHVYEGPAADNDGAPGELTWFTRVPIMRRDQWERIGRWPNMDLFADVWLSEKARGLGIETKLVETYRFVHHWSQVNRFSTDDDRVQRANEKLERLRKRGDLYGYDRVGMQIGGM